MFFVYEFILVFAGFLRLSNCYVFNDGVFHNYFIADIPFDANVLQPLVVRPLSFSHYLWPLNFDVTNEIFNQGKTANKSVEVTGRTRLNKRPLKNQLDNSLRQTSKQSLIALVEAENEERPFLEEIFSRPENWLLALSGVSLAGLGGGLAGLSIIPLLNSRSLLRPKGSYRSCTATSGESGICTPIFDCRLMKGTVNGLCPATFGKCCINTARRCGDTVKYNNTYWISPNAVDPDSPCSVTITTDPDIVEQLGPICQLRLDFERFVIAPPNSEGVCNEDIFQIGGTEVVPVPSICGFNSGQHMYLTVPAPVSSILLSFKLGNTDTKREWRIKISMFSCLENSLLAPTGCLQYFTTPLGSVKSFNWADTVDTATRQLANQDYHICFRRELVDNSPATTLCVTPSVAPVGGKPFILSSSGATAGIAGQGGLSQSNSGDCNNDFLIVDNGYDPQIPRGPTNVCDRFCGERLNCAPNKDVSGTVCTTSKPFRISYYTNDGETTIDSKDATGIGNLGFSLRFDQRVA